MAKLFDATTATTSLFTDSIAKRNRGRCVSLSDLYGPRVEKTMCGDTAVHDANFAFLTTALAKLHTQLYEPLYYITWQKDVPVDFGGGFVDYVEYRTVNWAGITDSYRNVVGNNVNYIPRVNASVGQDKVDVYTYEVAYDLRFIELEKADKLNLQKSIQDIYNDAIVAGWNLFVQEVAYTGLDLTKKQGLFNNAKVYTTTIDNSGTTGEGFEGLTDDAIVAFFNGIFETYLRDSNMNVNIIPDTILIPTFVQKDLVSRFSALYSNTLYNFILEHNLGTAQAGKDFKITIEARPALDKLGNGNHGRVVAYKKNKQFVRIDIPYPMQHYITLPNIEKMSYTSAFVGQVSDVQLPYNTDSASLGVVTYWDFTN